ncbi:MAG: NTP transferase domain-containing protein [Actinomycetota bacterium]|nr:NTP transferase domain-containing protein [Actinomycetota bacterium]
MKSERPVLVILAAGLGRRYGGLKPLAPIGARGEAIIDLSVRDAIDAGFGSVVLVVRPEIEATLGYHVKRCWPTNLDVELVRQDAARASLAYGAPGDQGSAGGRAPLGTAPAVLSTRALLDAPFGVVNADDLYGTASYRLLYEHLCRAPDEVRTHALVGFRLRNTIVGQGPVKRAICEQSEEGFLVAITERTITVAGDGSFCAVTDDSEASLTGDELVSVNMWGFLPSIFSVLQAAFDRFIAAGGERDGRELLLPDVVGEMVADPLGEQVRVLATQGRCIGVTHGADLTAVREEVETLVSQGVIPDPLWAGHRVLA